MSFRLVTTRHVNQHGGFTKAPFTFDIQVKSTNSRIISLQCNNMQSTLSQTTSFQSICYRGTPQLRRRCVRQGPQLPSPNFSAHVRCGQTAGWTKMLLGMEVGLGPGDFVLDGDSCPALRGAEPPVFDQCLLYPNGWMDEDATLYGSRPRPRPHCVRRKPGPPRKGHSSPPPFFSPCLLWPRSPISATAELLLFLVSSLLVFCLVPYTRYLCTDMCAIWHGRPSM